MKITILTDKIGSAIHEPEMTKANILDRHEIVVCDVHPKRPSPEQLDRFYSNAINSDVIDYQYWKSAEMVRELYPDLKSKFSLLTHHNPYDIGNADNDSYDGVFTTNNSMKKEMQEKWKSTQCILHGIDLDFFEYRGDYTEEKTVNMVVGRFEGKKGVLPVAKACQQLGYKMLIVGKVSKPEYAQQVFDTGVVEFHENVSNEELREIYYKSAIHVCNSVPNFESGTLPMLEAMACGVPVVTRMTGHVPDFYDGKNAVILEGEDNENVEEIKKTLKELMDDRSKRVAMIGSGLKSVMKFSAVRRAMRYNDVYYRDSLVSVIIPTFNDPESMVKAIASVETQDYQNIEVIVANDGSDKKYNVREVFEAIKEKSRLSMEYVNTFDHDNYGLAKSRNLGAISSYGHYLLFLDQRFILKDNDFVSQMMNNMNIKIVTYPAKEYDGVPDKKTGFLEGICMFRRKDFFDAGMFNERINEYGGMSQEIRVRLNRNGFEFLRVPSAIVCQTKSSRGRVAKQKQIRHMKDQLINMGMG